MAENHNLDLTKRKNVTAWTPVGLSPPFVSINDYSGHVIEIIIRAPAGPDGRSGVTASVCMSRSQFEGIIERSVDYLRGTDDSDVAADIALLEIAHLPDSADLQEAIGIAIRALPERR